MADVDACETIVYTYCRKRKARRAVRQDRAERCQKRRRIAPKATPHQGAGRSIAPPLQPGSPLTDALSEEAAALPTARPTRHGKQDHTAPNLKQRLTAEMPMHTESAFRPIGLPVLPIQASPDETSASRGRRASSMRRARTPAMPTTIGISKRPTAAHRFP